ncbi:hypothetical protein DHW03_09620 [Pedobacter yonginense]|uniref:Uncharacterized protein n=1 Tax=Pedobacter yonginense TaxID=651869 RepID=A0A317EN32_9SPHI|nr:PD40 domain-containing protein [Pedobacter yonginense]PWS27825.1 hypothetical protein DHW03_09620 [Pedobacter yonginense]
MTKISIKILSISILCLLVMAGCGNQKSDAENSKAILDTISLSNKDFALAYQDGNKIVATSIDTMKQISFGGATNPAISPDGSKLAYTVKDTAEHTGIWVADMENKSQSQLKVNSDHYDQAVWSPNGGSIAFTVINGKNVWKIAVIKSDNTGYLVLDSASKTHVYSPTWKNEKEIVAQDLVNLYTFDVAGKLIDTKPILSLLGKDFTIASHNRFFYTKDQQKIIFTAGNKDVLHGLTGPSEAVYLLDLTSKKIERISPEGMNVPYVFVTADDRIFYSGTKAPFTQNKIYVSDLKGNSKLVVDQGTNPTAALK